MLRLKQFSLVSTHVLRRDYFKMIYISPNRPSGFCLDPKHTKLGSRHVNHFLFSILITVGQNQGSQYLNLINSRKWKNLSTSCQPQSKLNPLSPGVWILVITWGWGVLSATVFGNWLLLLNSFTYCIVTSWLFLNIKHENFGQNLNLKLVVEPKL